MTGARLLVTQAAERLATAGVASPRVDAELLLAAVLGVSRGAAVLRAAVPASAVATYEQWVERRAAREPLQHIVGDAAFRHVVVRVGPGVFVPRPETELLVDAVLPHLRAMAEPLVVDLCSGSGALAAALANEVPGARVIAVEKSADALQWLARNVPPSVQVVAADVTDPELLCEVRGRVDAVVCNPPYVPSGTAVAPEVRADPAVAVFAGPDGLDLIPTVAAQAGRLLRPGGLVALEHDETHADAVVRIFRADEQWAEVADHDDLAGRPRYVTARRVTASSAH